MKEYLENRIKELKEADAKFCADRWDEDKHPLVRKMARENSNSVTLARQELESALAFFVKLPIHNIGKSVACNNYNNGFYADFSIDLCENCGERKGKHK